MIVPAILLPPPAALVPAPGLAVAKAAIGSDAPGEPSPFAALLAAPNANASLPSPDTAAPVPPDGVTDYGMADLALPLAALPSPVATVGQIARATPQTSPVPASPRRDGQPDTAVGAQEERSEAGTEVAPDASSRPETAQPLPFPAVALVPAAATIMLPAAKPMMPERPAMTETARAPANVERLPSLAAVVVVPVSVPQAADARDATLVRGSAFPSRPAHAVPVGLGTIDEVSASRPASPTVPAAEPSIDRAQPAPPAFSTATGEAAQPGVGAPSTSRIGDRAAKGSVTPVPVQVAPASTADDNRRPAPVPGMMPAPVHLLRPRIARLPSDGVAPASVPATAAPPPAPLAVPSVRDAAAVAPAAPARPQMPAIVHSDRLGQVQIAVDQRGDDVRVTLGLAAAVVPLVGAETPRLVAELAAQGHRLQTLDFNANGDSGRQDKSPPPPAQTSAPPRAPWRDDPRAAASPSATADRYA